MSKTPNSVPALRPALAEQDWDFSAVPIDELVPCLLWEYLRESHTAQQLFLEAKRLDNMSKLRPITEGIKINDPLELSGFVDAWFFASLYPNALNTPWQLLIPRAKRLMTTPCALVDPAVYLSKGDLHIDQLQVAIRKAMKDAHEERPQGSVYVSVSDLHSSQRSRAEVTSNKEDCDPVMASYIWKMVGRDPARPLALHLDARGMLNYFTLGSGSEAFCIVVDWARYNDAAIRAAFGNLVDDIMKMRPPGIPETAAQSRRKGGAKGPYEWQGKLNDIGRTRLAAAFTAVHIIKHLPNAHALMSKKGDDHGSTALQKKLNNSRSRFEVAFKKVLAFESVPPLCLCRPFCVRRPLG